MNSRPLSFQRQPLFTPQELARIEETALRLLDEHGIKVLDDTLREDLARRGFRQRDRRILIEPSTVCQFLQAERQRHSAGPSPGPREAPASSPSITVYVSPYPQHVHDLGTDRLVPFTTERLIEATKLLDSLADRGVVSSPPGCPTDPPPALQPVVQYWVAATYSRQGRCPPDPKAAVTLPYIAEMAEILGHPLRRLPVYVFSPLTLGGESLRCVLQFRERLEGISVSSMPSAGCTAPIGVGEAFALAAAEIIGAALLLQEALSLPVHWYIHLFPLDLQAMAMVFGSPEAHLFELAGREVTAYFRGTGWEPWADNIHTNAKLPGTQACAEKSAIMTVGALLGARHFGAVGTLSLDEAFSAEQLLYDLEIKDSVERLVRGLNPACEPEAALAELADGLRVGNFVGLPRTLEQYRDLYWHPQLFDRRLLAGWQAAGQPDLRKQVREKVEELIASHEYRLEETLQREIDTLLSRAQRELGPQR